MFQRLKKIGKALLFVGGGKTLFFNFYFLPFRQAIRLPILLPRKTTIWGWRHGRVEIRGPIRTGMIDFSMHQLEQCSREARTFINLYRGSVVFNGACVFGRGATLNVAYGGHCVFGRNVQIGHHSRILCRKSIVFGNDIQCSWEVQIMDTDFHYIQDLTSRSVRNNLLPITIGDRVWIANRVSILKGSVIPNGCVVAIGSIVKRLSVGKVFPENCILAGIPAVCVKEGVEYVWDSTTEQALGIYFK